MDAEKQTSIAAVRLVALVILLTCVARGTYAQDDVFNAPGLQQGHGSLSEFPFEHIDTFTGSVILTFTDLALPGNAGHDLVWQRTYNTKPDPSGAGWTTPMGWTFGIAGAVMSIVDSGLTDPILPHLYGADGGIVPVRWQCDDQTCFHWVITGDFAKYDRVSRRLYIPDGTWWQYDGQGRPIQSGDQYGWILYDLVWSPTALEITQHVRLSGDRLVRAERDETGKFTSLTYGNKTWAYNWRQSAGMESVTLPTGADWAYTYGETGSGALTKVRSPNGGEVSYSYEMYVFPRDQTSDGSPGVESLVIKRRDVKGRGISEGHWDFAYMPVDSDYSTRVTSPDGSTTDWRHDGATGYLKSRAVADGAGIPVETETVTFVTGASPVPTPRLSLRTIERDGRTYMTRYVYECSVAQRWCNYDRPESIFETGQSASGVAARTTRRTYDYTFTPSANATWMIFGVSTENVTVGDQTFTMGRTYTDKGFVTTETNGMITTTYNPDAQGNVASVDNARQQTTSFSYEWGVESKVVTPELTVTRTVNPDGTIGSETRGRWTTGFEYDDLFRRKSVKPPAANPTTITYAPDGSTVTVQRDTSSVVTTLDGFGRPIKTVEGGVTTTAGYDAQGRKAFESYPFTDVEKRTTFTYDGLGRLRMRTNPGGSHADITYPGGTVTVSDENGHVTVQTRQAFGDPDETRLIALTDADEKLWQYAYNARGRLTQVTMPDGKHRTWEYDVAKDRLLSETHPESGTTTYSSYDEAGNLKQKTDANGTVFVYDYDGNDRLKKITAGGRVTTIVYEPNSDKRQTVTVDAVVSSFHYDAAGRVDQRLDEFDTNLFTTKFGYDDNDNLKSIMYPSGRSIGYDYSPDDRLIRVYDIGAVRNYATGFQYHPSGAITSFNAGNGILHQTTFDPNRYWVRSISAGLLQLAYDNYDQVGNVRTISDGRGTIETFTYDALDRLRTAVGPYGDSVYDYDAHGNRITSPGRTAYAYEGDTLRLAQQGDKAFTYYNNGNLKTESPNPNRTYTYTPHNLMESVTVGGTSTFYAYDGDDWRVKKAAGTSNTYYLRGLNGELLVEWKNPGEADQTRRDYVYAGSQLIAVITK
jgi:YD repeat-containing protein